MNLNNTIKTLIVSSCFIAGIASYFLLLYPYLLVILVFAGIYFCIKKDISIKFTFIWIAIFAFGIFYTVIRTPVPDNLYKAAPVKAVLRGRVSSLPVDDMKYRYKFEFQSIEGKFTGKDWNPLNAKSLVYIYDRQRKYQNIKIGDLIEIKGNISLPFEATNPHQFNYRRYLNNNGIFTIIRVNHNAYKMLEHPKSGKWLALQKLSGLTERITSIHAKYIKSPELEVLGGIVFGGYAVQTPQEIKQEFINAGLLHLLAASGMNVGMILMFWMFTAKLMRIPYKIRVVTGMALVLVYAMLTGLPPSIVRATLMLEFILLGKLLSRDADNTSLIALVCAVMLLFDPYLITNIGFQLSFLVTFGIFICTTPLSEKLNMIPKFISEPLIVPVIAQLWATPIQLFYFNTYASYSIPANILSIPLAAAISYLGFTSSLIVLIPIIGEPVCKFLDMITLPIISILLQVSGKTSDLSNSLLFFPTPSTLAVILFYVLILLLITHISLNFEKRWLNAFILSIIGVIAALSFSPKFDRELKLLFFDVGEADSALIKTPDHRYILIDTANSLNKNFNPAKIIIVPYLKKSGIEKLDALILTHPDKDHIGGTIEVLQNFPVKKVMDNGDSSDSKFYKALEDYYTKNKINVRHLTNGEKLDIDKDLEIRVIKANKTDDRSNNENSIVIYLKYKDFTALFMGDSGYNTTSLLKKYIKEPVDIIKVGHHGSYNSLNEEFIGYLKPKLAVISVGKNKYNHPNLHILKILQEHGVITLRTEKDHAIEAISDGQKIIFQGYNGYKRILNNK